MYTASHKNTEKLINKSERVGQKDVLGRNNSLLQQSPELAV
jgi:hypothetical protein